VIERDLVVEGLACSDHAGFDRAAAFNSTTQEMIEEVPHLRPEEVPHVGPEGGSPPLMMRPDSSGAQSVFGLRLCEEQEHRNVGPR
jgi:hypothetical protein